MNKIIDLYKVNAYFVHSYNFLPENNNHKIMTTNYKQEITAMVCKKNIIGTQFHPEKSHVFGLKFLETFLGVGGILMELYPAIDLKDGRCIRLKKGKLDKITRYNNNPLLQAKEFEDSGAKWIHMGRY